MRNKEGTTLFRHELAYVLGQMQSKAGIADLLAVLQDTEDDPIVRHEVSPSAFSVASLCLSFQDPIHCQHGAAGILVLQSQSSPHTQLHSYDSIVRPSSLLPRPSSLQAGEALGAIADPATLPELDKYAEDARPEVAETCQIAARRVRWVLEKGDKAAEEGHAKDNPFHSVDPAPAVDKPRKKEDVVELQKTLMDASLPLFERYRAMFSLRNGNNKSSVLVSVCRGESAGGRWEEREEAEYKS